MTMSRNFPFEQHLPNLLNVTYAWTETGHFSLMGAQDGWRVGYSPPPGRQLSRRRVLLAGDAAHLNSPSGGMGMNSGIHDARNLVVDTLARVRGGAEDGELGRYARQRRLIAAEDVQKQSNVNYRRHRETDRERREIHWAELWETAAVPARHRALMRNASMIPSVAQASAIV